ncbi:MAG: class IV adenylate cyclase [Thermoguttaceae bacterium]|jgi:adenylate cyclase class 2
MQYEVEQKFPVSDMPALQERLIALGATIGETQVEVDLYFGHPARDFSKTDEALRIRRIGAKNCITYKGPKIDITTKTRREIELPLPDGEEPAKDWGNMLQALGFEPVGEVLKWRRKARILWQSQAIECALDDVQGLGEYCELELITNFADLEPAKACIAALAEKLGLKQSERRSYLELLLETGGKG